MKIRNALRGSQPRGLVALVAILVAGAGASMASAQQAAEVTAPAAATAPASASSSSETGRLAWYGKRFAGRRTASGQRFNPAALTMAHRSLPFGTKVKVTNVANGRSVVVRVNDRGPTQPDRIGDVSQAAARSLGMLRSGVVDAELEVL